jgi:hypothetical protein
MHNRVVIRAADEAEFFAAAREAARRADRGEPFDVYESSTFGTRVDVAGGRIAGNAGRGCGADARRCRRRASRRACG